jgi:hypothetical protein
MQGHEGGAGWLVGEAPLGQDSPRGPCRQRRAPPQRRAPRPCARAPRRRWRSSPGTPSRPAASAAATASARASVSSPAAASWATSWSKDMAAAAGGVGGRARRPAGARRGRGACAAWGRGAGLQARESVEKTWKANWARRWGRGQGVGAAGRVVRRRGGRDRRFRTAIWARIEARGNSNENVAPRMSLRGLAQPAPAGFDRKLTAANPSAPSPSRPPLQGQPQSQATKQATKRHSLHYIRRGPGRCHQLEGRARIIGAPGAKRHTTQRHAGPCVRGAKAGVREGQGSCIPGAGGWREGFLRRRRARRGAQCAQVRGRGSALPGQPAGRAGREGGGARARAAAARVGGDGVKRRVARLLSRRSRTGCGPGA